MRNHQEITLRLQRAVERVYEMDRLLIELEVHERTIATRLAIYLQEEFPEWNVDCEYNRDARAPKKVLDRRVYPDVIIHRRNSPANLLAIEMKGYWSNENRNADYRKLSYLTGPRFKYETGVHIELEENTFGLTWFAKGRQLEATP